MAYKRAARLNEEKSWHWPWPDLNLGTLYFRLARLDEAETALRQALKLEGRFPAAHFRLGQVLEKKGDRDGAFREFKDAISCDPSYPEPHYALARIHRQRGDARSMERSYRTLRPLRQADVQRGVIRPN